MHKSKTSTKGSRTIRRPHNTTFEIITKPRSDLHCQLILSPSFISVLSVFLLAPESLTMFCRSILDAGRSRFLCPYISQDQPPVYCGNEWDYIDVRRLAVLTDDEIEEFEKKMSRNYLIKAMGVQECPKCNSMVERSDKKHIRVICPLCTKTGKQAAYEFCWHCLHEWKSSGTTKCGKL